MIESVCAIIEEIEPLGMGQKWKREAGHYHEATQAAQDGKNEQLLILAEDLPTAAGQGKAGLQALEHGATS
jgi:hypothetical protein